MLTLLAVFVWIAWDFRKQTVIIAEQSAWNIATLLNQAIARDIELYDYSMQAIIDGLNDPEVMALPPRLKQATLFDRSATAHGLGAMVALDENGTIFLDSLSIVPRAGNFADRDYFQPTRMRPAMSGSTSASRFSVRRAAGASISISRRISAPGSPFRGVVSGTLKLEYLRERLGDLAVGKGGSVTLLHRDGTVIVRNADIATDDSIGRNWSFLPLFDRLAQSRGGFVQSQAADGVPRLYAYQTVGDLPLVVSVGLAGSPTCSRRGGRRYGRWRLPMV